MANAELRGAVPRQEGRELAGVEVIGIVGRSPVLRMSDRLGRQPLVAKAALWSHEITEAAALPLAQPVRHEIHMGEALRDHQGMVVRIVLRTRRPPRELAALLECGIAFPEELSLRYAHRLEGGAHRRPRALPHADDPDVRRLDQRHRKPARIDAGLMPGGDDARGEPSGGSSADDDHRLDASYHLRTLRVPPSCTSG